MGKVIKYLILLSTPLLLAKGVAYSKDYPFKIVIHPSNPVHRLKEAEIEKIFLKKTKFWDSKEIVAPVDLPLESNLRKLFSEKILKRPVTAVKSYWQQLIFSGRGLPPIELESEKAVIEYVLKNKNAIGYVAPKTRTRKLKIVEITP